MEHAQKAHHISTLLVLLSHTTHSLTGSICKSSCTRSAQQQDREVEVARSFMHHLLQQDHTLFAALAELHVFTTATAHALVSGMPIGLLAAAAHAMTAHMRSAASGACSNESCVHVAWCLVQRLERDGIAVDAGDASTGSWQQLREALFTALQHGAAQASKSAELADLSAMLTNQPHLSAVQCQQCLTTLGQVFEKSAAVQLVTATQSGASCIKRSLAASHAALAPAMPAVKKQMAQLHRRMVSVAD